MLPTAQLRIAEFIANVVANWDTATVVDRLELRVGRDLQYIRMNGTIVGFLIGGLLYALLDTLLATTPVSERTAWFGFRSWISPPSSPGARPMPRSAKASRLAQHCEALGYHRYWCAEHHNSESQAGTAPEILIAAIAATTQRIRVGSAGVMLPHYSALKVAEQFRVLDAIAPGRIDLGLGRAPGSDGRTAYALNPRADTAADQFPGRRCAICWRGLPARS